MMEIRLKLLNRHNMFTNVFPTNSKFNFFTFISSYVQLSIVILDNLLSALNNLVKHNNTYFATNSLKQLVYSL